MSLRLGRLDHHLILLVAPGKRMVEGDVIAALHITSRDIKAEIIDDGSQRGDSVQLLEANLLNDVRTRHVFRRINKRVVSFVDHLEGKDDSVLVALQPLTEANETLDAVASVSFGCH